MARSVRTQPRPGIQAGIGYWSWEYFWAYGVWAWHYYTTDMSNQEQLYVFWFEDPDRNHYSWLAPQVTRFVTGSILNYYFYDWFNTYLVTLNEAYIFELSPGFGVSTYGATLTGMASATIADWTTSSTFYEVKSHVFCDVRESYPLAGSITVSRYDGGVASISFGATCVGLFSVRYADGQAEEFRFVFGRASATTPLPSVR